MTYSKVFNILATAREQEYCYTSQSPTPYLKKAGCESVRQLRDLELLFNLLDKPYLGIPENWIMGAISLVYRGLMKEHKNIQCVIKDDGEIHFFIDGERQGKKVSEQDLKF